MPSSAVIDRLEAELPQMLVEHKDIVKALESLVAEAKAENKPQYALFADKRMRAPRKKYPTRRRCWGRPLS